MIQIADVITPFILMQRALDNHERFCTPTVCGNDPPTVARFLSLTLFTVCWTEWYTTQQKPEMCKTGRRRTALRSSGGGAPGTLPVPHLRRAQQRWPRRHRGGHRPAGSSSWAARTAPGPRGRRLQGSALASSRSGILTFGKSCLDATPKGGAPSLERVAPEWLQNPDRASLQSHRGAGLEPEAPRPGGGAMALRARRALGRRVGGLGGAASRRAPPGRKAAGGRDMMSAVC